MNWKRLLVIPVIALMALFGVGVYYAWGLTAHQGGSVLSPHKEKPKVSEFTVSGTIIAAQDGNLYSLTGTTFTEIDKCTEGTSCGPGEGWQQPTVTPDHQHIIAVQRFYNYSDLYELSLTGQIQAQLTNNASSYVPLNQWSFFPHVDGAGTLYYTYDPKGYQGCGDCYDIDMAIYSMPLGPNQSQATAWTNPYGDTYGQDNPYPDPNPGSGGSFQAVPVATGGLIFTYGYVNTDTQQTIDQIAFISAPEATPTMLTGTNQSCFQPALSADGTRIAFVCTPASGGSTTQLEVASLSGGAIGTPAVVASGSMIASPTWSPDDQQLLYYDATGTHQYFNMIVQSLPTATAATPTPATAGSKKKAATPVPTATPTPGPQYLTTSNDFLSTSPAAWF